MAASELNNRLDYLISFSSQLVFVCSDKIPQQSQVVDSFLAHQNEQADLALLTANELTPLVTYREKLFRQLIGQSQKADFNRPLNQLLAPLNNHSGSILISIFQAEKLPNKLVKELWDLVLQSRFANNKQQLNVLLMGRSDWAESAKSSLGTRSKEQPIVLNNQIDIVQTDTEETTNLEAFIQNKRQNFARRIVARQSQEYQSQPIYKTWWVTALFGLVFLAVFSGILAWQYPEKAQNILAYINNQQATPVALDKTSENFNIVEPKSTQSAAPIPTPAKDITAPSNLPLVNDAKTKDVLVTDWTSASAKLEEQSNKILMQTNAIEVQPSEAQSVESEAPTLLTELNQSTKVINDYKIEDKVELEAIVKHQTIAEEKVEQIETNGFLTPKPELILALPNKHFVIQIASMANISILQNYITEHQLSQQLWLYKTQRYGGDWYVLLKNQHFTSMENARSGITKLVDSMLIHSPFVKSVAQVKQEISLSRR